MSRRRSGRRPGGEDTRGAILTAARAAFATHGFRDATIRAIAADAGVDPALVHHYFGTKEDLFAEAVEIPLRPAEAADRVMAGGVEHAGRNLAAMFFGVWEGEETRTMLLGMLRGAFTNQLAADSLRQFIETALLRRVAAAVPGPDAELRVALAASHLIGVAVLRYVLEFDQLAEPPAAELVEQVGATIQRYFDG